MAELNPTWPSNGEKPWGNKLRAGLNEVVDAVNDRPTFAEADAAIATSFISAPRRAPSIVFLGDSLTQQNSDEAARNYGQSFPTLVAQKSQGRLLFSRNSGIASNTSAQMLARLQADVLDHRPGACFLLAGSNDTTKGLAHFESAKAAYTTIIETLLTHGIQPIIATIPPRDDSRTSPDTGSYGDNAQYIYRLTLAWNVFVRKIAATYRVPLVDLHLAVTDPTTGNFYAGYTNDGVHWSALGTHAVAQYVANELAKLYPVESAPLAYDQYDVTNGIQQGLFLDSFSSGAGSRYPTGWNGPSTTTNLATIEAVDPEPDDALAAGKWLRMVKVNGGGQVDVNHIRTLAAWASASGLDVKAGDQIGFGFRYALDDVSAQNVSIAVLFRNSGGTNISSIRPLNQFTRPCEGTVWMEGVIPEGTHDIRFNITFPAAGEAEARIGQVTLLDLTAMGVGSLLTAA